MTSAPTTTITFLDALNERYGSVDDTEYDPNAFLVGFGGKNAKNNKKWEMVGMEKTRKQQSHHHRLATIVLKDAMITVPERDGEEGAGEIKKAGLKASEVDLSGNFELSVADVNTIVDGIPNLQLLQLNRIPLLLSSEERVGMKGRLIAEGRIDVVKKIGAKDETTTELLAKVLPELPKAFLNLNNTNAGSDDQQSADGIVPIPNLSSRLLTATWPNLKQLVLNGTGITSLMPLRGLALPACEEIHLDMNNIAKLFVDVDGSNATPLRDQYAGLANVKLVSLALNQLSNWHGDSGLHLIAVNAFPKLSSLLVGGNPLPNLPLQELLDAPTVDAASDATSPLPIVNLRNLLAQLVAMDISDSKTIDSPVITLDALRRFGATITTLRLSYETLFADKRLFPTESIARNLTIAALPSLSVLNRAMVRPKERVDAELYYVQRCVSEFPELRAQKFEVASSSSSSAEGNTGLVRPATSEEVAGMTFEQLTAGLPAGDESSALVAKATAAYPRYFELRQLYRHVIISQQKAGGGAGAGADGGANGFMIDVSLRADAFADQNKRLPATMTIQKVKVLAAALFSGLDASQMEVSFWITAGRGDSVAVPLVLDNALQTLGFYGVPSGAVVKIRDLRDKGYATKK